MTAGQYLFETLGEEMRKRGFGGPGITWGQMDGEKPQEWSSEKAAWEATAAKVFLKTQEGCFEAYAARD